MKTDPDANKTLEGSCHCRRIRFSAINLPTDVTQCNCSICRRYAAVWGYYQRREVSLDIRDDAAVGYQWNEHMINFIHCRYCGCLAYYEDVERTPSSRLALNFRMTDPDLWQGLPVRYFDGADTFQQIT